MTKPDIVGRLNANAIDLARTGRPKSAMLADEAAAKIAALRAEVEALRIGWWNDMRAHGVAQDNAIAKINTALENKGGAGNG